MGSGPWEELCDHWLLLGGGGERVVIVPILQMKKQKPTEAE